MLSPMEQAETAKRPWWRGDRDERGASLVEFALIIVLLVTLLLGIVIFGILLSKRQVLTQAAAEGARYAVPVSYTNAAQTNVLDAARLKTNQSLEAVGNRQCPSGALTNGVALGSLAAGIRCTFTIFDCASSPRTQSTADTNDCIEAKVELSVKSSPALVPGSGFIDPFLPNAMTGTSIVGLSGLTAG